MRNRLSEPGLADPASTDDADKAVRIDQRFQRSDIIVPAVEIRPYFGQIQRNEFAVSLACKFAVADSPRRQ